MKTNYLIFLIVAILILFLDLGFIESYLDPLKVRAEWEGFVSVVDKDKSKILGNLVDDAPKFISYLPW